MADTVSKERRSQIMSKIRSKNTTPELIVRKYLYSRGYRYRIHSKNIPGSPDISIKKYKIAIFINGCFWHGHKNCKIAHIPKSKSEFWENKITKNQERDKRDIRRLKSMGWIVCTVWECQLTPQNRGKTLYSIEYAISKAILNKWRTKKLEP